MPPRFFALAVTALFAFACSPDSPDNPSEERCAEPLPSRGTTVEGALELGEGDAGSFTSYEDGQQTVLIQGPQGGFMITPVLRADLGKMGTDGRCVYVSLAASIDGLDPIGLQVHVTELASSGSYLSTEPLPFLLAFDLNLLVGKSCTVSATWRDDDVSAIAQSTVVLVQ